MGNQVAQVVSFEKVQFAVQHTEDFFIINTLNLKDQDCLIQGTMDAGIETKVLNDCIARGRMEVPIIVYGRNHADEKVDEKGAQLSKIGFRKVYLYKGGMFEWLLLQEIYGTDMFPTTRQELDLLRFKVTMGGEDEGRFVEWKD